MTFSEVIKAYELIKQFEECSLQIRILEENDDRKLFVALDSDKNAPRVNITGLDISDAIDALRLKQKKIQDELVKRGVYRDPSPPQAPSRVTCDDVKQGLATGVVS